MSIASEAKWVQINDHPSDAKAPHKLDLEMPYDVEIHHMFSRLPPQFQIASEGKPLWILRLAIPGLSAPDAAVDVLTGLSRTVFPYDTFSGILQDDGTWTLHFFSYNLASMGDARALGVRLADYLIKGAADEAEED